MSHKTLNAVSVILGTLACAALVGLAYVLFKNIDSVLSWCTKIFVYGFFGISGVLALLIALAAIFIAVLIVIGISKAIYFLFDAAGTPKYSVQAEVVGFDDKFDEDIGRLYFIKLLVNQFGYKEKRRVSEVTYDKYKDMEKKYYPGYYQIGKHSGELYFFFG